MLKLTETQSLILGHALIALGPVAPCDCNFNVDGLRIAVDARAGGMDGINFTAPNAGSQPNRQLSAMTGAAKASAAATFERQVENAALVGCIGEPSIWPDDIAGQQKPEAWQNAKQDGLKRNPRRERGSDPPNKTHQQRNHDSSRRSDSDSLHRMNHSSETAL